MIKNTAGTLGPIKIKTEPLYRLNAPVNSTTTLQSPPHDRNAANNLKELFTALFKIKDDALQNRIMKAINGMPITCPKCDFNFGDYKPLSPSSTTFLKPCLNGDNKKHVQIKLAPNTNAAAPTKFLKNSIQKTTTATELSIISSATQTFPTDFQRLEGVNNLFRCNKTVLANLPPPSYSTTAASCSPNSNSSGSSDVNTARVYRIKHKREPHAVKRITVTQLPKNFNQQWKFKPKNENLQPAQTQQYIKVSVRSYNFPIQ